MTQALSRFIARTAIAGSIGYVVYHQTHFWTLGFAIYWIIDSIYVIQDEIRDLG